MTAQPAPTGRTAWARNLAAPVRDFLSAETGGAVVLLGAALAALLWANSPWPESYEDVWTTDLSIRIGDDGHLPGSAPLGERGPDDVLLPGARPGGQARVRRRGAARAAAHHAPDRRGDRRHGAARPDLPGVQRRRLRRRRLGRRDVDRHRLRARRARARRAGRHAPARPPAHDRGLRRPDRAAGDRDGVLGRHLAGAARDRGRPVRRAVRAALRVDRVARAGGRDPRHRDLGRAPRVGRRSGDRGTRGRPHHERVSTATRGSRARHRDGAFVPRAAHARARARDAAQRRVRGLRQRAAPVPPPPMDQLRDRAAVRARERGHRAGRAAHRRCRHLPRDAGDPVRVRGREAARDHGRGVALDPDHGSAARAELAHDRRGRRRRRHRVHDLAADLEPRVRGAAARGGEARRVRCSRAVDARGLDRLPRDRAAARRGAGAPNRRAPRRSWSTSPRTSIRSATTSAAPTTRRSRSSSTATTSARTAGRRRS